MRTHRIAALALVALAGCGLENMFSNVGRSDAERPASRVVGQVGWGETSLPVRFTLLDASGNEVPAFQSSASATKFEARFPSAGYSMARVQARVGGLALRALVPAAGEESTTTENLDARSMTETLIIEARLSATGKSFSQLTPAAYAGNGVDTGTRTQIRKDMDTPGTPAANLLGMVDRLIGRADLLSEPTDPDLFRIPVYDTTYAVTSSAISAGWIARNEYDYDADGITEGDSADFDAALGQAAQAYDPAGCPDPNNVRIVFQVDFNEGAQNGACGTVNRFKWATDKPGKQMFFVGWVHADSPIQDPAVNTLLGASVPNQIAMFDDGTHGDDVSGDNVWTISFDVPRGVRIGYKYTWGFRGAVWTGSEEWPGNSRIIQADDLNADDFVTRRDVFGDEASNKDHSNLNPVVRGDLSWDEVVRPGCGPEARENRIDPTLPTKACICGEYLTPESIGPLTVACPAGQ